MTEDVTDESRTWGETGWGWNAREPYAAPRYRPERPAGPVVRRAPDGRPGLLVRLRSFLTRHR